VSERPGHAIVLVLALIGLAAGCGKPARTIETQISEDAWRTIPGTDVQLRLGPLDSGELAIAIRDQVVAHGPPTIGTRLPVTIDDQACELVIKNTFEDTSVRVRPSMDRTSPGAPKVQNRDLQTRTLRGLTVELVSAAGPVPGSDASLRGARSLPSLPWGVPALILGLICGLLARPDGLDGARMAKAGTFGILALIGAGVCAAAMLDGGYAITYGILFGAWGVAGIVGGRLAEPEGRHTAASWTIAAVAAPFGVAALMPMWGIGGPILALIAGGVLAAIALIVAVSIKPTY